MSDIHAIIRSQIKQPLWDNWYIKEELGRGATGVVYRIEAKRENRTDVSALKIEPIVADDAIYVDEVKRREYLDRKRKEAENETAIMYKLRSSPNIVLYEDESIKPLIVDNKQIGYYIMIRMECLDCLQKQMRQKRFDTSEKNVLKMAIDIGSGIKAAHELGVIHRDVKPGNFFVSDNGTYKLGDFNISKKSVSTRSFAGTEGYIAPEIYTARYGSDGYTKQADIYSFGISLYCIMNNYQFPFGDMCLPEEAIERRMNGENLPRPKNASEAFAKVILKACAFNTADRYQNMTNMLNDLKAVRDGNINPHVQRQVVYVPPQPMPQPIPRPIPQPESYDNRSSAATKVILACGIAILMAILAILVVFLVKDRSENKDKANDTPVIVDPEATEEPETTEPDKTIEPEETSVTEITTRTTETTVTTTTANATTTTTTITAPQTTAPPVLSIPVDSRGVGSGNIVNGGYAVSDGNTLYYSDQSENIYAVRNDVKESIYNTRASYINVVGDNLIFCNWSAGNYICSIRKDGSGFNILNPSCCYELTYYDGWLYFTEVTDPNNHGIGNYICRMKPDGSEYTRLMQVHSWYMNVTDGKIFYVNYNNNFSLDVMNVDGSGHTVIKDNVSDICVSGGRIYYSHSRNDRHLYSMNYDGSDNYLIRDGYTKCINVVGSTIYCVDENNHLMIIDLAESSGLVYPDLGYVGYPVVVGSNLYSMDNNNNIRIFSLE